MDTYISTSLTTSSTPYTPYSDPSIITSLFTFGSSHTEYGYVVATVFVGVLRVLHLILSLPIVRVVVGAMPLYLEATREYLGSKTGVDILDLYYVTLGAFFGISTIVNEGRFQACGWETLVLQPDENVVGGVRKHLGTVSRVCMREGGRKLFWVVNIHYTHFATEDGRRMREQECRRVVEWMKGVEDETEGRVVVLGDHNTLMKKEGIFGIMKKEGYKSAHKEANGREPRCTWPSGLKGGVKGWSEAVGSKDINNNLLHNSQISYSPLRLPLPLSDLHGQGRYGPPSGEGWNMPGLHLGEGGGCGSRRGRR